jgi:hypothetical protein
MKHLQLILRILIVGTLATALAYWAGTETTDSFVQNILLETGAKELTDLPEYQGIGFAALFYGAGVFLLVFTSSYWSMWKLSYLVWGSRNG